MSSESLGAQRDLIRQLNKLAKWRQVFAGWQLGTRSDRNAECAAVRDHREATILMRAELTALIHVLQRQGVFTAEEYQTALAEEAALLDRAYELKFPGIRTSDDGVVYQLPEAVQTMQDWLP